MGKYIVCLLAVIVLGCVGMWLFWHAVSALYYLVQMGFLLGLVGLAAYVAFVMLTSPPKVPVPGRTRYQISDTHRSCVYGFRSEPGIKDVVALTDDLKVASLELTGEVVQLANKSTVKILEQKDDAIKVKVVDLKSKDNVFWVPRANVIKKSDVFHFSNGQIQEIDSSLSVGPARISNNRT